MKMKTIASFEVDHTKLKEGIYLSRKDRDVVTYDPRFIVPNNPENVYMENAAMHTVEHLFAVHARNGKYGENIIYFFPIGCRTGFYLLTSGLSHTEAIFLILETVRFIADYEGKIPGTEPRECGNCREHDLAGAKKLCADYYEKVKDWTEEKLAY